MTSKSQTTDNRHICDYPVCSVRGAGHPLACNCRSGTSQTTGLDPSVRGYLDAMQVANKREYEIRDIQTEFHCSAHAMASEIWELRRIAYGEKTSGK